MTASLAANFQLLSFWSPGPGEMLLLLAFALLLYGGDLPKVARSWGKSLTDFRRGLSGIQNEINDAIYSEPQRLEYRPEENLDNTPSIVDATTESPPDESTEPIDEPTNKTTQPPTATP